jgi:hypothetical protein
MIRSLGATALTAASLLAAAPANAACVGEQSTLYVCVTAPEVTLGERSYCVYAGGDDCTEVAVPVPETSGEAEVSCGGRLAALLDALPVSLGPGLDPRC